MDGLPCVDEDGDFPGGSAVKNPPANAGDISSIPDPGISHMLQLSPRGATKPMCHN